MIKRPPATADLYVYSAELVRVIDGDTVVLDIDLGIDQWARKQHCRLIGINAPEPHTETRKAGDAATWRLRELLKTTECLLVRTHYDKKGTFRRLLVELWADGINLNQRLVDEGHAEQVE